MSGTTDEAGHRQPLLKRLKNALAAATLLGAFAMGSLALSADDAAAETRTLRLKAVNTGETLNVTYKVNGRYIPSALEKINYLLRDWRRNKVIRIDPKTIDLMWELHTDLGSKQPIHIICGYRSPGTNAFLKRIGRGVARKSQHVKGKAIDLYFPDVSTERIRNSALVRMVGGVGYYRRGGGPRGFVHIDSGNVRHWPRIAPSQLARIFKEYRSTVGRRMNRNDEVMIASAETEKAKAADDEDDDEEDISEDTPAKGAPPAPAAKPALAAAKTNPVPVPRDKPIDILFAAAVNMVPAAATPERQSFGKRNRPAADPIGSVEAAETIIAAPEELVVNTEGKGSFAAPEPVMTAKAVPAIRTVSASAGDSEVNWWPKSLGLDSDETSTSASVESKLPSGLFPSANAAEPVVAPEESSKGDMLEVTRELKGDLQAEVPGYRRKLGQLINQ
jgi:uncharacterized protein YcbK (DUF882 family)